MIRWAQVFMGTSTPILKETHDISHLEGKWIYTLIQAMQQIKWKICIHELWVPQPHQEHDRYIMDEVLNDKNIQHKHIKTLNQCRIFRKHTFLSRICSSDDTQLTKELFENLYRQHIHPLHRIWVTTTSKTRRSFMKYIHHRHKKDL